MKSGEGLGLDCNQMVGSKLISSIGDLEIDFIKQLLGVGKRGNRLLNKHLLITDLNLLM